MSAARNEKAPPPDGWLATIVTEDGTTIVTDSKGQSGSGRNLGQAIANYRKQENDRN